MKKIRESKFWVIVISIFCVMACNDAEVIGDENAAFDRTAMLQNMTDNVIKPNFAALKTKTDALDLAVQKFATESNEANLKAAQTAWEEAYTVWQYCNAFNFGPAEFPVFGTLIENVGIFPVNTVKIEENIAKNSLSFDNFFRDTRGFLALDYLLFDVDGNAKVLAKFGTAATVRKQYLKNVSADIQQKINEVNAGWTSYEATFIKNNGTDAGSSTSYLYNEFIKSFEGIKNFKVLLPAGKRVGQTQAEPTKVEAYYSGKSLFFLKEHLKAVENIWLGRSMDGKDGVGFEEYLNSVTGGKELITSTKSQLAEAKNAINALPENDRLSQTIETNVAIVEKAGIELQKQTRFFKSDMSSLLGIAITYSSGDGD